LHAVDSPIEHVALVVIACTAIATTALGAPWWVPVVLTVAMAAVMLPRIFSRTRPGQPVTDRDRGDPEATPTGHQSTEANATETDSHPTGGGPEPRLQALSDVSALAVETLDDSSVDQACVMAIRDVLGIESCEICRAPGGGSPRDEAMDPDSEPSTEPGSPPWDDQLVEIPISPDASIVVKPESPGRLDAGDIVFLETMASVLGLAQQRSHAARDADRSSRIDEVTGLVNRPLFLGRLRSAITRSKRQSSDLAVMLFGLDNFRFVNESLGHSAGDALLETCARRLSDAMRPGDLVARLGGDEFVVLATGLASAETAAITAERLRSSLEGSATIEGRSLKVAASAGLALATEDSTAEEVLQQADLALHSAKASGGGRVEAFDPEMLEAAVSRLRTDGELRKALTEGQLRVFYQPIVDLATGRTVAAEALVRWFRNKQASSTRSAAGSWRSRSGRPRSGRTRVDRCGCL
jgi:diguanylate cyclase (GGDEF)-like protein